MAQNSGQPRRHEVLVTALARGTSHTAAAKLAGVSRRTVQRKLDDPKFREKIQRLRNGLIGEATGRVVGLLDAASNALNDLLVSETESIRLSAARCVFDVALKLKECSDLESRLQILEDRINDQSGNTPATN